MFVSIRLGMAVACLLPVSLSAANAEMLIHLQMTEGSGTTTANAGTLGGEATIEDGLTWKLGDGPGSLNAISFGTTHDSSTYQDGILLPAAVVGDSLDNLANYTVTMWVRMNVELSVDAATNENDNNMHAFYGMKRLNGTDTPDLWINRNGHSFDYRDTGDHVTGSNTWDNRVGTWQFMAFTLDNGTGNIYVGSESLGIDAGPVFTLTGLATSTTSAPERFAVGAALNEWHVNNMPGDFADVRLYDATLTADELDGVRLQSVPEPSTLALLCLGLLGVAMRAWRRHSA